MSSSVERFSVLFAGLTRAFGQYVITPGTKADGRGKIEGRAATWSDRPIELDDYQAHLDGTRGLGVCPLTDDNTVNFAAIDIDIYPIDPREVYGACQVHNIPLTLCRTKSGGLHCYVFFSEPVEASLVRERLRLWATLVGHTGVEVFPKQDTMDERMTGNWINLPYFGGEKSLRYAYKADGSSMTVDEFLDHVEGSKVDRAWQQLDAAPTDDDANSPWHGAPPCLVTLSKNGGFMSGARNNALFNVGLYLKKRHGSGWKEVTRAYNQRYFDPPLRDDEVRDTLSSVGRRSYNYMCRQPPICAVCDRRACLKVEFGVGEGGGGRTNATIELGRVQKILTEPPTWRITADGKVVELETADFFTQSRFWFRVGEETDRIGETMQPAAWRKLLQEKLDDAEHIAAAPEGTLRGEVRHHLVEFCTSKVRAKAIDELLDGKPWTDDGRTYFVPADFLEYLHVRRCAHTRQKLMVILHDVGLESRTGVIKGKVVDYWSVPEPAGQSESFEVPTLPKEEPF